MEPSKYILCKYYSLNMLRLSGRGKDSQTGSERSESGIQILKEHNSENKVLKKQDLLQSSLEG